MYVQLCIIASLPFGGWYGVTGERQTQSSRTVGRASSQCMPHYQASSYLGTHVEAVSQYLATNHVWTHCSSRREECV